MIVRISQDTIDPILQTVRGLKAELIRELDPESSLDFCAIQLGYQIILKPFHTRSLVFASWADISKDKKGD